MDPAGLGTPLMAGYAADPVNTALGNFVEVETDLAFGGLLAGLTFARTYNSRSDRAGPFGARWSSWAIARAGRADLDRRVRGPGRATGRASRGRVGRVRPGGRDPRPGGARAAGPGWRWPGSTGAAGSSTGPAGSARTWAGPGTGVAVRHDEDGRLVELAHERGRRMLIDWDPDGADRRGDRLGRAAGRLPLRRRGRLARPTGRPVRGTTSHDEAGRVASVTDADGVVELVNTSTRTAGC